MRRDEVVLFLFLYVLFFPRFLTVAARKTDHRPVPDVDAAIGNTTNCCNSLAVFPIHER